MLVQISSCAINMYLMLMKHCRISSSCIEEGKCPHSFISADLMIVDIHWSAGSYLL